MLRKGKPIQAFMLNVKIKIKHEDEIPKIVTLSQVHIEQM